MQESRKRAKPESFAAIVRELRRGGNLTLQQLGDRCGLAPSTISKIENGQLSPSYETIVSLADGLRVDVAQLFTPTPGAAMASGRRCITKRGKGAVHPTPQYRYEMLCTELSQKHFTPLLTRIKARDIAEFPELLRHAGEEFIFVVSGTIELHTEFYEPARLDAGDSCYFDSKMGHACISVGDGDAVVVWITSASGANLRPAPRYAGKRKTSR